MIGLNKVCDFVVWPVCGVSATHCSQFTISLGAHYHTPVMITYYAAQILIAASLPWGQPKSD